MAKHFFDHEDGDFCRALSDNLAMDSEGDLLMRLSDNLAMDLDSGDIHFVSGWSNADQDD